MADRMLHPREEPYRWAIERLDEAFGRERVRLRPRNHHHVISVAIGGPAGDRAEEIALRNPTYDLNREADRDRVLGERIAEIEKRFAAANGPAPGGQGAKAAPAGEVAPAAPRRRPRSG